MVIISSYTYVSYGQSEVQYFLERGDGSTRASSSKFSMSSVILRILASMIAILFAKDEFIN
jgi:hypothetical protein